MRSPLISKIGDEKLKALRAHFQQLRHKTKTPKIQSQALHSSVHLIPHQPSYPSPSQNPPPHQDRIMSSAEPPAKKHKSEDWANHKMNLDHAVVKKDEDHTLTDIASQNIQALQGIGLKKDAVLEALNLKTVKDLGKYKYFKIARAIKTLADREGKRPAGSAMNIDHALVKEHSTKSFQELLKAPLSALEGFTDKAAILLSEMGVKTIGDLADFKYCKWAEAILELAAYEELKTAEERKVERELHKLE